MPGPRLGLAKRLAGDSQLARLGLASRLDKRLDRRIYKA